MKILSRALVFFLGIWAILHPLRLFIGSGLPRRLLIVSGVLALLAWCVTDTELKPEHVRNSEGKITPRKTLSIMLVQIILWAFVCFLAVWIVPHLPRFFLVGWRLPLTRLASAFWRWFALLMVLQYVSDILWVTSGTGMVAVMAALGSQSAERSLIHARWRLFEMEESADSTEKGKERPSAH